jgi:hypothetical protein
MMAEPSIAGPLLPQSQVSADAILLRKAEQLRRADGLTVDNTDYLNRLPEIFATFDEAPPGAAEHLPSERQPYRLRPKEPSAPRGAKTGASRLTQATASSQRRHMAAQTARAGQQVRRRDWKEGAATSRRGRHPPRLAFAARSHRHRPPDVPLEPIVTGVGAARRKHEETKQDPKDPAIAYHEYDSEKFTLHAMHEHHNSAKGTYFEEIAEVTERIRFVRLCCFPHPSSS